MDASQLMMASGGMIALVVSLFSLLIPLFMLILLWKISKATSNTANQLERLIAQVDHLLQHAPATTQAAPAPGASLDLLASAAAPAAPPAEPAQDDLEEAFSIDAPASREDSPAEAVEDDGGYEFPDEDNSFDNLPEAEAEEFAAEAAATGDGSDDFDFPMDDELPAAGEELASDFGIDESPAADGLSDEEEAALGGAFGAPAEQEDAGWQDAEEESTEESEEAWPEARTEEETPAEEAPAIVKLEDDPARPDVSMARCGKCDHKLAYKKNLAGRKARCPSCKEAFILP